MGSLKRLFIVVGLINLMFFSSCFVTENWKTSYKAPDYSTKKNWAALPTKKDKADKVPHTFGADLKNKQDSAKVDVFFVHNTTFWLTPFHTRALLWDPLTNILTNHLTIKQQASVFNGSCKIYAPRYRQASLISFTGKEGGKGKLPFEFAYEDVKNAFEYYLKNYNKGRPFIIASHSQGSFITQRLIKEYIETNSELYKKLVAAYLVGWANNDTYTLVSPCYSASQTGCMMTWQTVRWGAKRTHVFPGKHLFKPTKFCTNPLTWTTDTVYAGKEKNLGSTQFFVNKVRKQKFDAQVHDNLLWVHNPHKSGYLRYVIHYHLADYNLFYMNIRENVALRVNTYLKDPKNK